MGTLSGGRRLGAPFIPCHSVSLNQGRCANSYSFSFQMVDFEDSTVTREGHLSEASMIWRSCFDGCALADTKPEYRVQSLIPVRAWRRILIRAAWRAASALYIG